MLMVTFHSLFFFSFFTYLHVHMHSEEKTEGLSEAREEQERYLAQASKLRQEVSEYYQEEEEEKAICYELEEKRILVEREGRGKRKKSQFPEGI